LKSNASGEKQVAGLRIIFSVTNLVFIDFATVPAIFSQGDS